MTTEHGPSVTTTTTPRRGTRALLEVRDLEVSFATDGGVARVLDRVDLRIGEGEIVGLVGESGCGKTTLARAILGVLPTNSARVGGGSIHFQGESLLDKEPDTLAREVRGREITFVPQDPFGSFNPVFTVGAQIRDLMRWKSPALRGDRPPMGRRERQRADHARVVELLRTVQIPQPEQALAKYPHELSGGQRQRIMIAMALLPEPKLIIADEPTTALDVTIQAQILKLLRRLAEDHGVAVLFTTHDLGTAYEICDRVTVMYAGQEMESATSEAFFNHPAHPYTRKLLDSLPSRDRGLRGIPGEIPALVKPPPGCRFHPRCDRATERCARERPSTETLGHAHGVRCFHPTRPGAS
ncbi:MAG: ABC transporter ATP-binding protein [Ectothiorhodospiraceae bacterium]|nr:ABC transporter ATP-binding protein [Ectothiorhodospiraceae bacterium]